MQSHSERIAAQKRADLLHYLLHEYHLQEGPQPITQREKKLLSLAGKKHPYEITERGIEPCDVTDHAERNAYYIVTQQEEECREVELPGHEKQMTGWRIAQGFLFIVLIMGIIPIDSESGLPRPVILVLFLAFTAISAWCRYCDTWYSEHQRRTALLNAMVGNAEVKKVLLNKRFAERIRKYYISKDCEHRKEIAEYLRWWHEIYSPNEPFKTWVKRPLFTPSPKD